MAAAALLDQAFGPLGLERVSLHTDPSNERSRAVARRLGFVEEGLLRQGTAFPDERRDELVYGLLAEEWHKRSAD
jgi:RimJ/RimL family protein N-acetyltransferase